MATTLQTEEIELGTHHVTHSADWSATCVDCCPGSTLASVGSERTSLPPSLPWPHPPSTNYCLFDTDHQPFQTNAPPSKHEVQTQNKLFSKLCTQLFHANYRAVPSSAGLQLAFMHKRLVLTSTSCTTKQPEACRLFWLQPGTSADTPPLSEYDSITTAVLPFCCSTPAL